MLNFLLYQVKRLEGLLSKCKDTIRNNKEKSSNLAAEKDALKKQLEELKVLVFFVYTRTHTLMLIALVWFPSAITPHIEQLVEHITSPIFICI